MTLVKVYKLLILRLRDRHFQPILAPKSRFSATCSAQHLAKCRSKSRRYKAGETKTKTLHYYLPIGVCSAA